MPEPTYHLFLSYARADDASGWVTAFEARLRATHQDLSRRPLSVFFDREAIRDGDDWQRRIYRGLRTSRLFLAFLSPNYLASPWCRREWEEYLRLEHTLARGDDGILPIYFVTVDALHGGANRAAPALDSELATWIEDLRRRNRSASIDLRPWFPVGPEVLRELDAAERLAALHAQPRADDPRDTRLLAERITAIDRRIAARLDQAALAELAPGNIDQSYAHFVGRHRELRQLHESVISKERIGLVGAVHGLGGQGKTALALQYAYAYAETYAAGGRWLLSAEKRTDLLAVLEELIRLWALDLPSPPETLTPDEATAFTLKALFAALERRTREAARNAERLLSQIPARHTRSGEPPRIDPHLLLILDNVDQPALLSARTLAAIPREDWLQVVITTRLDPSTFGGRDDKLFARVAVDDLPLTDALALVREYQPNQRFASPADEAAAGEIVRELGGFTLAVELVAAFLQAHPSVSPPDYLARLRAEGLPSSDSLAADAPTKERIRHREAQVGVVLDASLARLPPAAREALDFAALLPPDSLVVDWLRDLASGTNADLLPAPRRGYPDPWDESVRRLIGMRLLVPTESSADGAERPRLARIHRLVAAHLQSRLATPEAERRIDACVAHVHDIQRKFEAAWQHDRSLLWMLRPLGDTTLKLLEKRPESHQLSLAAGVVARAEMTTGQLHRAEGLLRTFAARAERSWQAHPDDAQAARLHSLALGDLGDFDLRRGQAGDAERALDQFQRSRDIRQQLADANPQDAQAARDLSISLNKLGDFYLRRGQAGDAERALDQFQRSKEIAQQLADANPQDAQAARDLSVSHERLGDFYLRRGQAGDAERALDQFQRSRDIRQQLADANPQDAQAARDLSISLNKLGDFYLRRGQAGDAERALDQFQRSKEIAQQLADANPQDAQAARDLSVSHERLGDFDLRRGQAGDAERALDQFQRSRDIRQQLADANPQDAQAARDLSISLNKLGDFYLRRGQAGDAERALDQFQRSKEIAQQLADANPQDAQAARDLSISLNKLGDFYLRRGQAGDAERALDQFQRSKEIAQQLADANPQDAQAARDLSISLNKLGDFYLRRGQAGDAERALDQFQRSRDIRQQLADANPQDAQAARDLSISLNKLGDFYLRRGQAGDAERALDQFQRCHATLQQLADANPQDAQAARDLSVSHYMLARHFLDAGDEPQALQSFQRCFEILDAFARAGRPMDEQMRAVHQQLSHMFGNPTAG